MQNVRDIPIRARGVKSGKGHRFNIAVYEETYGRLLQLLRPRESMDELISRILDERQSALGSQ